MIEFPKDRLVKKATVLLSCTGPGDDCPLCKAGNVPKPQLVLKEEKTGRRLLASPSLSERLYKLIGKK